MNASYKVSIFFLTVASTVRWLMEWSKYNFGGTENYGAGAIAIYTFMDTFSGAIFGLIIAGIFLITQKLIKKSYKFPIKIFLVIWSFFIISNYYVYFRLGL